MNPAEAEGSQAINSGPAVRWNVFGQTVVKPRNDRFTIADSEVWRRNEDRLRIHQRPDALLAAVADGAGASGLYCGAWAETLVSRLPADPIADLTVLDTWMAGFCLDFGRAHAVAADRRHHAKLVREGSCSTLTACWLRATDVGCDLHWLGYGDSPLLLLEQGDEGDYALVEWHPRPLTLLQRDPQLLNWKDVPTALGFRSGALRLPRQCCIVLATDAVGLYLLSCYGAGTQENRPTPVHLSFQHEFEQLAGTSGPRGLLAPRQHGIAAASFAAEIASLRQSLRSEQSFAAWLFRRHQKGLVANDDATVIIIDVEIPVPEPAHPPTPPSEVSP